MLNYKTVNGYQIPDLKIPDGQAALGRYGRMRKAYLKEHRKMTFNSLLLTGELTAHLAEIDRTAGERGNLRRSARRGGKNTEQGHGAPPFCLACPKDENIRA